MPKTVLVIDLEGNILTPSYGDEIGLVVPNDCIARPVDEFHRRDREKAYRHSTMYGQHGTTDHLSDAFEYFSSLVNKNMTDCGTATGRTYHKGTHSTKAEWRKSMKGKR